MLKHHALTIQRIDDFVRRLQSQRWRERIPLSVEIAGPVGRISHEEAQHLEFRPVEGKFVLEPLWATFWFRLRGVIPESWRGNSVDLLFHSHAEALLWINGRPAQGLNFEGAPPGESACRIDARLPQEILENGSVFLEVEAACNTLNGSAGDNRYPFAGAELAVFDQEAWDLFHDLFIPSAYLNRLLRPNNPGMPWLGCHVVKPLSAWEGYLLERLNDICNVGDPEDRSTWPAIRSLVEDIYRNKNATYTHEISALGHCHIDTAWLWPIAETKRKCARSFSSALAYMKRYPEYKFACSQAQHYQWMKESYPDLFAEIKEAVKAGQWIPVGGTWIEPDCNIPSGESLVRQFLYGKRFFREEFGWDCKEFWNPDGFGFSGALPQIIRGAGMGYFLTQKTFWNQFNKPECQNFLWRGIDGSEVLTHFPPVENYNAMIYEKLFSDLLSHEEGAGDHEHVNEGLLLYGLGDGGGGPTPHMLEVIRRAADFQGVPRTQQRDSLTFFSRLEERMRSAPVIEGELYLELHRGTYTTQAAGKLGNRKGEILLRNLEMLSCAALYLSNRPYPAEELERLWKILLLNQFHDILPGTSITEVHEESRADYALIEKEGTLLLNLAAQALGKGEGLSILNLCGWTRRGLIETREPVSESSQKNWRNQFLARVEIPSCGAASLEEALIPGSPAGAFQERESLVLENNHLRALFSTSGRLLSLREKSSDREVIVPSLKGNRFVLFEDRPFKDDAWDVEVYHLEKPLSSPEASSARIIEYGPLRAGLEFIYNFGPSAMIQRIFLSSESEYLEFECEVDWHHRHQFLKVEFPVEVHSPEATFEIQFGHIRRPTHFSSQEAVARFEVSAHRWIDLGESGFGVSLFTDCKYGYAVHQNVMRVSLLRGTEYPAPKADLGHHVFRYAMYPHPGDLARAETVRRAYEFSMPWIIAPGRVRTQSWFSVSSSHLIIDTVKKAEDSDAIIIRLYECHGARGDAMLHTSLPLREAWTGNLLEEPLQSLPISSGEIPLSFLPFQLLTIIVKADDDGMLSL